MTRDDSQRTAVEQKPPRLQFSLLAVFWLVTAFAICCSIGATLAPSWHYLPRQGFAMMGFVFWPLAALALAVPCPGTTSFVRRTLFVVCGLGAIPTSLYGVFAETGGPRALDCLLMPIIVFVGLVFWTIQTFFVLGVIDYFRRRKL